MKRITILAATLILSSQCIAQEASPPMHVRMNTNQGEFVLKLFPDKAPKTVENFLRYVDEGFYDGTIFHRVIGSFVIQGGGFTEDFQKKPTHEPVLNEADNMLPNRRGTIAMARTAHPHSATSQFFINVADNIGLNHTGTTSSRAWGYTVFGEVVSGMEVVDAIRSVETGAGGPFPKDVPLNPVVIQSVTVLEEPPAAAEEEDTAGATEG